MVPFRAWKWYFCWHVRKRVQFQYWRYTCSHFTQYSLVNICAFCSTTTKNGMSSFLPSASAYKWIQKQFPEAPAWVGISDGKYGLCRECRQHHIIPNTGSGFDYDNDDNYTMILCAKRTFRTFLAQRKRFQELSAKACSACATKPQHLTLFI